VTLVGRHRARRLAIHPVRQHGSGHIPIFGDGVATGGDGILVGGVDDGGIHKPEINRRKLECFRVIGIAPRSAKGCHRHRLDTFRKVGLGQALG
jgi:hypothetical protein